MHENVSRESSADNDRSTLRSSGTNGKSLMANVASSCAWRRDLSCGRASRGSIRRSSSH
jgi:hypothetical protein